MRQAVLALLAVCHVAACHHAAPEPGELDPDAPLQPDASGDATADAANPFDVPLEQWTWMDVPGMVCADGSHTGIALNPTTRSSKLLLFFQGGGACWESGACFVLNTAVHLDGYTAATFASDRGLLDSNWALQRGDATSPFGDATWVYVPYCTGDLHSGTRTNTYQVFGGTRDLAHKGGLNVDAMLARIQRYAPTEVFTLGVSAGGFGAQLNFDRIAAAFPGVPVHVLADSAQPVAWEWQRYGTMQSVWGMRFPAACTTCAQSLVNLRGALAAQPGRYGVIAALRDNVLEPFLGLDDAGLTNATRALATSYTGTEGMLQLDITQHVLLGSPEIATAGGVTVRQFVTGWASGTSAFATTGP